MQAAWHDIFFTSRDGLRLYGRHYQAAPSQRRPVLCLPGLTRNARDFHALAVHLSSASKAPRDVFAIDYRGRGRSDWDADWRNYALEVELFDLMDFMTLAGLHDAAIIGSSRGGLLAMILGLYRPTSIGLAILNDIGPVVEREGMLRMVAYVGRVPLPSTWDEATELVRGMSQRQFPAVQAAQWGTIARQWYNDDNGRPSPGYDDKLGKAVSLLDGPIPPLWSEFQSLSRVPTLVIRGERSDILTERTVDDMRARHPGLEAMVVAGQGHSPLLMDVATHTAIEGFLALHDRPVARGRRQGLHAAA